MASIPLRKKTSWLFIKRHYKGNRSAVPGSKGSKGSKGSEGSEGKVDGASPRGFSGFVSLTGRWPEGCGLPLWAMLIKSALRDLLSVSYVMISTTVISHLRWLFPPFGALRHHLPAPLGSVSHDSQVALLPYELCSLATAERWDNKALKSSPFISSSQHNGAL